MNYLKGKQKSKEVAITFADFLMLKYLLPSNDALTVEDKQNLFSTRNC